MNEKRLSFPLLITAFKIFVSVGSLAFLVHYFLFEFPEDAHLTTIFSTRPEIIPVLLLCGAINWALESYKWKILIAPCEHITLNNAFKGVISGVTIGLFTPNRMGEYAGRLWFTKDKTASVTATIAGNICQLTITLLFGFWGIWMLPSISLFFINHAWLPLFMSMLIALGGLILLLRKFILKTLEKKNISFLNKLLTTWKSINPSLWWKSLLISTLRYLFFWIPFAWLLLGLYDLELSSLIWIVPVTYFIQAFVPTFAIAEAGTRAITISWVASLNGLDPNPAIMASLIIWLVNVILPSFIGLIFIWKIPTKAL